MKPFAAVQSLIKYNATGEPTAILGSCFRLDINSQGFVTAQHCLEGLKEEQIKIMNATVADADLSVHEIYRHPKADIAVIFTNDKIPKVFEQFHLAKKTFQYGAPAHCFGIVCDYGGFSNLTPRAIVGFTQRDFTFTENKYESKAIEISAPIPKAMSGGPVFYPPKRVDFCEVFGVAIGTIESETVVHAIQEYKDNNVIGHEKISRVIEYGVVLELQSVKEWLESTLKTLKDRDRS